MRDVESSPQLYARLGGALHLLLIVLGIFAEAIRDKLIVSGNAAATAANITSKESLRRFGIASEFVALISATALAMIYFVLLRPVSKELNLLATFLRLVAIAIQALAVLNLDAALFPLANAVFLGSYSAAAAVRALRGAPGRGGLAEWCNPQATVRIVSYDDSRRGAPNCSQCLCRMPVLVSGCCLEWYRRNILNPCASWHLRTG